jgi:hypothetical protein
MEYLGKLVHTYYPNYGRKPKLGGGSQSRLVRAKRKTLPPK